MKDETLEKIFRIDKNKAADFVLKNYSEIAEKNLPNWNNRKKIYKEMLDKGVATSKLQNREKIFELLGGYYELRQVRNLINHANTNSEEEISSLKIKIENYLNKLFSADVTK